MNGIQFIEKGGRREYAVLPYPLYERLLDLLEQFYDHDDGFRIPDNLLRRELAGESPVKLWREYRGLTLEQLAAAGMETVELERIERDVSAASDELLTRVAGSMAVPPRVLMA
ncbi:MAG: helix-turn-helix transcriptional regulator [Magnetococcales bacterium]|nr:helix-turn-helix transcriptional regulator [Magnetococcales bacterium]